MQVVAAVSTPISAEHARDALVAAMPGIDRESAALLLSLIWVETGRGNLQNWNAGNITAGPQWTGMAWRPPWFEDTHGTWAGNPKLTDLHDRMLAGTAPSAFRAYNSATEGFADFVRVLHNNFASVLDAARSGDPATFVQALHDSGYSRDYTAAHIPTFTSLRAMFAPLVVHLPEGAGVEAGIGGALAFVAAIWLGSRALKRRKRTWHY